VSRPLGAGGLAALMLLVLLLGAPATAGAQCPRTSVADLEDEVMCPVCGTSLGLAIEAPQAKRERAFIQGLVERCESKDRIKAALVAEFGEEVLAEPSRDGFDLAAYAVPALALGAGLVIVGLGTVRWRRRRAGAADPSVPRSDAEGAPPGPGRGMEPGDESARLDADLARYDL